MGAENVAACHGNRAAPSSWAGLSQLPPPHLDSSSTPVPPKCANDIPRTQHSHPVCPSLGQQEHHDAAALHRLHGAGQQVWGQRLKVLRK